MTGERREGAMWSWLPVSFGLIMTILLAIVVGIYHLVGDIQLASFGGTLLAGGSILVGCATVIGCGPTVVATGGAMAGFGGVGLLSMGGGVDTVALQVQNASELRSNGVMPHLVLASTGQSETDLEDVPLEDSVQEYVYCSKIDNGGCSPPDFQSRVDSVMGGKPYRLEVTYDNQQVISASSGTISSGPTAYRFFIPIKGGKRAVLRMNIEGPEGGVWWE